MEKAISIFQIICAAFFLAFAIFTTLRCIIMGSDVFYTIVFATKILLARWMFATCVAEYKAISNGNNERNANH